MSDDHENQRPGESLLEFYIRVVMARAFPEFKDDIMKPKPRETAEILKFPKKEE